MAAQHTSTEASPKGHFPPFDKETFASQLFWLAIAFIALYVMISRFAIPRIGGIMASRARRITDDLSEAKRLKVESDAAIAAHEKALADARARAQALANETRGKYAAEAEIARKSLDATLNERIAEAERTIAARRATAMANVQAIANESATAIVERLIGSTPAEADVTQAVAAALKR